MSRVAPAGVPPEGVRSHGAPNGEQEAGVLPEETLGTPPCSWPAHQPGSGVQADTSAAGGMTPAPAVDEPPRYRRFLSVRYRTPNVGWKEKADTYPPQIGCSACTFSPQVAFEEQMTHATT